MNIKGDRTWSEGDYRYFKCGGWSGGEMRQECFLEGRGCVPADASTLK